MLAVIPRQAGQKVSLRSGEKMSTSATLMHDNRSHSSVHGLLDTSYFAKKTLASQSSWETCDTADKKIKKALRHAEGFFF
jgi:hypothetical protein